MSFNPIGAHNSNLVISSAVVISPPAGLGANVALLRIQAISKNVRYTLDGTTPTASSGFELVAGDPPIIIEITENTIVTVIEELASSDLEYQWGN